MTERYSISLTMDLEFPDPEKDRQVVAQVSPEALSIIDAVLAGRYITRIFSSTGLTDYIVRAEDTRCPKCGGTGWVRVWDAAGPHEETCDTCQGTGIAKGE